MRSVGSSCRICARSPAPVWGERALATLILDRFDAANLLRSAAAIGQGGGASTGERMAVPLKLANCALVLLVALDREAAEMIWPWCVTVRPASFAAC